MDQDEIVARLSIMDTLATYNLSGDAGLADRIAATFADDGVLDIGTRMFQGKEAILAFYRERQAVRLEDIRLARPARHFLSTSRIIVVASDDATAFSYFLLVRCGVNEQVGSYDDRFRRRPDGRWLIAHRKVDLNWSSE
ncbi:hypothetical protein FHS51_003715 [Sphingobium wenxiniae]|nr:MULTISPECIES: nuclear transport factor 2 family protein [Sphingobium]KMS63647.1 hypothetical protein V475_01520 [Sphingobium baderi LL03]MBB6193459.1 hypothetical protein [Sphingobium wenxiniae]WRD77545.1 nuclear transport factor 2 family protein [Sphingobium baderi]